LLRLANDLQFTHTGSQFQINKLLNSIVLGVSLTVELGFRIRDSLKTVEHEGLLLGQRDCRNLISNFIEEALSITYWLLDGLSDAKY